MENLNPSCMDFALEELESCYDQMEVDIPEPEPILKPVVVVKEVDEPTPGPSNVTPKQGIFKKLGRNFILPTRLALHVELHPLLIPNVITDVLTFLSANEVELCRLVCQDWNHEGCKVLRKKRTVVFSDPDALRVYNNAMRHTTEFPHAQFEFGIPDFTGLVEEDMREFWRLFGFHVKKLDFRQTNLFWGDLLDVVGDRAPNVKTLTFRNLPRNLNATDPSNLDRPKVSSVKKLVFSSLASTIDESVERLADVLKVFENVEEIEFLPIKNAGLKSRVSVVLMEVFRMPEITLPCLKKIKLPLQLDTERIEVLVAKGFPLEYLQIEVENGTKAAHFKDLCVSFRRTLQVLQVNFPETFSNLQTFVNNTNYSRPEESIQNMGKLKSLVMINFKGSVNFVQNLTELETLRYSSTHMSKTVPFGFMQNSLRGPMMRIRGEDHHLKSLKIISLSGIVPETLLMDGISRCFPFLKALNLRGVDNDDLGVIYRNLPLLSRVELLDAKCTDQGLTGISQEVCTDMVETSTFIVVDATQYRQDLFIGSLQFLQVLVITSQNLTNATVGLGLVDCRNLRRLKIGSSKITDTAIIYLTDKLCKQLDLLDVSECDELTEQSKFYAKEKVVGKLVVKAEAGNEDGSKKSNVKKPESDRKAVKTKRRMNILPSPSTGTLNKLVADGTEFFEEPLEEDRERRHGFMRPNNLFNHQDRGRQRTLRIREAIRRNYEFMRQLIRLGACHVRHLVRTDGGWRFRRFTAEARRPNLMERLRGRPNPPQPEHIDDYGDGQGFDELGMLRPGHLQPMQQPVPIDEVDIGPMHDEGPHRLPEFYLAEISRLELHLDDVEYWIENHGVFDREGLEDVQIEPPDEVEVEDDVEDEVEEPDEVRREVVNNPIPLLVNAPITAPLEFEEIAIIAQAAGVEADRRAEEQDVQTEEESGASDEEDVEVEDFYDSVESTDQLEGQELELAE